MITIYYFVALYAGSVVSTPSRVDETLQNGENTEIDHFMSALKSQITVFSNRMKSNVSRRRPLVNDATLMTFFNSILPMRQQLLEYIHTQVKCQHGHWDFPLRISSENDGISSNR